MRCNETIEKFPFNNLHGNIDMDLKFESTYITPPCSICILVWWILVGYMLLVWWAWLVIHFGGNMALETFLSYWLNYQGLVGTVAFPSTILQRSIYSISIHNLHFPRVKLEVPSCWLRSLRPDIMFVIPTVTLNFIGI